MIEYIFRKNYLASVLLRVFFTIHAPSHFEHNVMPK